MKSSYKTTVLIASVVILFMINGNYNIVFNQINTNHYSTELIFERKFNSGDDFFASASNRNGKSIFTIYAGAPFRLSYNIPVLAHIDEQDNYYLIYGSVIKIYDKDNRNIKSFEIPNDFNLDYIKSDKETTYFYYSNYALGLKAVYKLNISNLDYIELNRESIDNLDPSLKSPTDPKEWAIQWRNFLTVDGFFYGVSLSNASSTIFKEKNGFYFNPGTVYINKYDAGFDITFSSVEFEEDIKQKIPSEYRYDTLNVESLFNDRIIYLSGWYVNQQGDIYFTGIKSNEMDNRVEDVNGRVTSVDIIDPTFIFCRLENSGENKK